jgi:hypothetical protein
LADPTKYLNTTTTIQNQNPSQVISSPTITDFKAFFGASKSEFKENEILIYDLWLAFESQIFWTYYNPELVQKVKRIRLQNYVFNL